MKLVSAAIVAILYGAVDAQREMVKICPHYPSHSGHARTDPIISQTCPSDHVHTFYGPQNFHPNTNYTDLLNTLPSQSSSPFEENQSLYWHPTVYAKSNDDGIYTRTNPESTPYYRWDNSVTPRTEAFPPEFRMIAASNDPGATNPGELKGTNLFTECCNVVGGGDGCGIGENDCEESCTSWEGLHFPTHNCGFLGIGFAMPTCWDGKSLGDDNDHHSHMAYTLNGKVAGECPTNYPKRFPQIQLFVRINQYMGATHTYELSDGNMDGGIWHVDFFNGWKEGKLQEMIDDCGIPDQELDEYNPGCECTEFLTKTPQTSGPMCDDDIKRLIINEETETVSSALPRGTCNGQELLVPKSWNGSNLPTDLGDCRAPNYEDEDGDDGGDGGSNNINYKKKANQCYNKVLNGKDKCKCFATSCILKKMAKKKCYKGLGTQQQKKKLRNMLMYKMESQCANQCSNKVLTGRGKCKCWAMKCLNKKVKQKCMKGLGLNAQQKKKLNDMVIENMETRCEA